MCLARNLTGVYESKSSTNILELTELKGIVLFPTLTLATERITNGDKETGGGRGSGTGKPVGEDNCEELLIGWKSPFGQKRLV